MGKVCISTSLFETSSSPAPRAADRMFGTNGVAGLQQESRERDQADNEPRQGWVANQMEVSQGTTLSHYKMPGTKKWLLLALWKEKFGNMVERQLLSLFPHCTKEGTRFPAL